MTSVTWDGQPIATEPPYGAAIIVYRRAGYNRRKKTPCELAPEYEFLILHRSYGGTGYEGAWAWTPPSGARQPGEDIEACAARELKEEVGLMFLPLHRTDCGQADWVVYTVQVDAEATLRLSLEHDRCEWVCLEEAARRCQPQNVSEQILCAGREIDSK